MKHKVALQKQQIDALKKTNFIHRKAKRASHKKNSNSLNVEKQNNPASKCHFIPAVLFKKMRQLSDRICLFQHVCQFRPA
ncbi:hypothetical protein, partial [Alkalibacterium sp. s-m-22]